MTPVLVNTLFELGGVALGAHSVVLAARTRPVGVSVPAMAWSSAWAVEASAYYLSHGETVSSVCAVLRCVSLCLWCWFATRPAPPRNMTPCVSSERQTERLHKEQENTMGLFGDIKLSDVKVGGGKAMDFKGEGDFVLSIVEIKGGETRKREKYFEVIHQVVESTNPAQPIGSKTNLFCMLAGAGQDLGLQNMKEILCTLSGLNPHTNSDAAQIAQITDEKWIEIAELACADQKTFGGTLVNVSVVETEIKNKRPGGRTTYLRRRYSPNAKTVAAMVELTAPVKTTKAGK